MKKSNREGIMGLFSLPMSDCVNMKPHVKKIINGGNMQIEVTEINKISLNENELLFIKIPRIPHECLKVTNMFQ